MEIATGYFAKSKAYSDNGYALVSIALKCPWFLPANLCLSHYQWLYPTPEILKLKDSPPDYTYRYTTEILYKLQPGSVYQDLEKIANEEQKDKVVLMCYEAPDKFCHRHIVSHWLEQELGIDVNEVIINSNGKQK